MQQQRAGLTREAKDTDKKKGEKLVFEVATPLHPQVIRLTCKAARRRTGAEPKLIADGEVKTRLMPTR
jgi:hypothetical protein